jgi:arylsulfatase A-like enzyme
MTLFKTAFRHALLLTTVAFGMLITQACGPEQPYNVLLIVADDMNEYGFFHTHPQVKTPALDAFRQSSISFRNAYCPAPACSPSRTAFLSGVSPHRSGKYYNGSEAWSIPLMQNQETLMEWFQRAGFNTYGKGKLFHSQISRERVARNFVGPTGKAGFGPFPDSTHRTFGSKGRFRGVQAFAEEEFPDSRNAENVIEILQEKHEKPFFIMYGLWRPHSPYTCPQRFLDMYNPDEITIPKGYASSDLEDLPPIPRTYIQEDDQKEFLQIANSEAQWKRYLRGYFACYTYVDYNIGRVLDALEASEYAENTIVVVTSDNGFHMGEKDRFNKNSLWEQSAITPMAIRVPGSGHGGEICRSPVNLQDLYPTFVDYCGDGLEPLQPIDGNSIRELLEDPATEWENPSITYFGQNWVSVRSERFRFISYPDGTEELYDHQIDPWELNNLAGNPKYEKEKAQLKRHHPEEMAIAREGRWTTKMKRVVEMVHSDVN